MSHDDLREDESLNNMDGQKLIEQDHIYMWLNHLLAKNVDGVGGLLQSAEENEISQVITLSTNCKFG